MYMPGRTREGAKPRDSKVLFSTKDTPVQVLLHGLVKVVNSTFTSCSPCMWLSCELFRGRVG